MNYILIYKSRILLFLWLFFLSYLTWDDKPYYIDEYYSTFIANGICIGCFWGGEVRNYISANPCDPRDTAVISKTSKLTNVWDCASKDGGNAIPYYMIAHYWTKVFGGLVGVLRSLKILTFLFFLASLLLLISFLRKEYGAEIETIGALFYISVGVPILFFVRTYTLSALMSMYLIITLYNQVVKKKNVSSMQLLYIAVCILILPFLHYFNSFILVLLIIYLAIQFKNGLYTKVASTMLKYSSLSLVLIFIYYSMANANGKQFQNQLSAWYLAIASKPELKEYKPALYLSSINLLKKNIWSSSRAFGLKLNQANYDYKKFSIRYLLSYFGVFIYLYLVCIICIFYVHGNNDKLFQISVWFLIGYFFIITLLSIKLGHLIPFNEQYVFILFPVSTFLFCSLYTKIKNYSNTFIQSSMRILLILVMINALLYSIMRPEIPTESSILHERSLQKLESCF